MSSLAKVKVVGVKLKRQSAPPPISTDRTELKVQEIPPELCHLTGDALATPFPPIALGGYIKYYKAYPEYVGAQEPQVREGEQTKVDLEAQVEGPRDSKKMRRASSASMLLGPLLSHMPAPSPSHEMPLKSHLFHIRSRSSPENTSSPISPRLPSLSPRARRQRFLSIIPEASRETMRPEMNESISLPTTPRKSRVISHPSAMPTPTKTLLTASALTLSLNVSPPAEGASSLTKSNSVRSNASTFLSRGGSLRRKKRQVLRTPSVENDFARSARELFGLGRKEISAPTLSRENSNGSETTEEDNLSSPTVSINTALTSVLDSSSLPPSPSSPTELGKNKLLHLDKCLDPPRTTGENPVNTAPLSLSLPSVESSHKRNSSAPSTQSDNSSGSDTNSSLTIGTPLTSFATSGLSNDEELRRFVILELVDDDESGSRESWASFATAKSSIEPLPVVKEAAECSKGGVRKKRAPVVV
ncbi:hypothetical protein AN958_07824 [Leucoagaricus sp. SymC.cos]|nr:hypothetical protein AN958_07824 [Leucoagaricus sp. SymC.cos]